MSTAQICPRCGQPLPPDAPRKLCPNCLLALSFEPTTPHSPGTAASAPSPEAIAPHFPALDILDVLGQGGMGVVYKARQKSLGRLVALKILPPDVSADPTFAERFQREARALARLNHPNIVVVHESGNAGGYYYLLMEYVEGTTLRDMQRSGKLTPRQALRVVSDVCNALQYAHDEGIIHRDIKPENILFDKRGKLKIADFGLAKLAAGTPDFSLTGSQMAVGTPHYMAPEQLEHPETVDHRADIYALGVVLYELLTGELPLGRFDPPSHTIQLDVRLDEVVLRALEKQPERRYQRLSELRSDVQSIAASMTRLVRFACPQCGHRLKADSDDAGKTSRCPRCGTPVTVPPAPPEAAQPVSPAAVPPPAANAMDQAEIDAPSQRLWIALSAVAAAFVLGFFGYLFFAVNKPNTAALPPPAVPPAGPPAASPFDAAGGAVGSSPDQILPSTSAPREGVSDTTGSPQPAQPASDQAKPKVSITMVSDGSAVFGDEVAELLAPLQTAVKNDGYPLTGQDDADVEIEVRYGYLQPKEKIGKNHRRDRTATMYLWSRPHQVLLACLPYWSTGFPKGTTQFSWDTWIGPLFSYTTLTNRPGDVPAIAIDSSGNEKLGGDAPKGYFVRGDRPRSPKRVCINLPPDALEENQYGDRRFYVELCQSLHAAGWDVIRTFTLSMPLVDIKWTHEEKPETYTSGEHLYTLSCGVTLQLPGGDKGYEKTVSVDSPGIVSTPPGVKFATVELWRKQAAAERLIEELIERLQANVPASATPPAPTAAPGDAQSPELARLNEIIEERRRLWREDCQQQLTKAMAALRSDKGTERLTACGTIEGLASVGVDVSAAVPLLANMLKDHTGYGIGFGGGPAFSANQSPASNAAEALGEIRSAKHGIPAALIPMIRSGPEYEARAAAFALAEIDPAAAARVVSERARSEKSEYLKPNLLLLSARISNFSPRACKELADFVAQEGSPPLALPGTIDAGDNEWTEVLRTALAHKDVDRAVLQKRLEEKIKSEIKANLDTWPRRAHALGILGQVSSFDLLQQLAKTNDRQDRDIALWAIGQIPDDRSVSLLLDAADATTDSAVAGLASQGDRTVGLLATALRSGEYAKKLVAAKALERMGQPAVGALDALTAAAGEDSADLPEHAIRAIGNLGDAARSAVPAMRGQLANSRGSVRAEAAAAIIKIEGYSDQLWAVILEAMFVDNVPNSRTHADATIASLGPSATYALPALEAALYVPNGQTYYPNSTAKALQAIRKHQSAANPSPAAPPPATTNAAKRSDAAPEKGTAPSGQAYIRFRDGKVLVADRVYGVKAWHGSVSGLYFYTPHSPREVVEVILDARPSSDYGSFCLFIPFDRLRSLRALPTGPGNTSPKFDITLNDGTKLPRALLRGSGWSGRSTSGDGLERIVTVTNEDVSRVEFVREPSNPASLSITNRQGNTVRLSQPKFIVEPTSLTASQKTDRELHLARDKNDTAIVPLDRVARIEVEERGKPTSLKIKFKDGRSVSGTPQCGLYLQGELHYGHGQTISASVLVAQAALAAIEQIVIDGPSDSQPSPTSTLDWHWPDAAQENSSTPPSASPDPKRAHKAASKQAPPAAAPPRAINLTFGHVERLERVDSVSGKAALGGEWKRLPKGGKSLAVLHVKATRRIRNARVPRLDAMVLKADDGSDTPCSGIVTSVGIADGVERIAVDAGVVTKLLFDIPRDLDTFTFVVDGKELGQLSIK